MFFALWREMNMLINPELRTEPEDNPEQEKINQIWEMHEAETAIGSFLDDYKHLFPNEIRNFMVDIRMAVSDMEADDED